MNTLQQAIYASVSALAVVCATGAAYGQTTATAATADAEKFQWNIPQQSLADALIAWSERSRYVVLIQDDLIAGLQSPELVGAFTKFEALDLLLADSGLAYRFRDAETLVVTPRLQTASMTVPAETDTTAGARASRSVDTVVEGIDTQQDRQRRDDERASEGGDQIVVTGTRVRGASPTSPVLTVTRDDIDRSGFGDVGELMRSLPSNFAGGANPGNIGAGAANSNITNASTINLRGLGGGATLTLINGRRLAGDTFGQAVDFSIVPLAAVQRVEVVADGSSAIYGSDAVAGVVNFVLRKNYDGLDLSARVGGSTEGGGFSQNYSALGGISSDRGYALANVEYSRQEPILASDRDFTSDAPPDVPLNRFQEKTSVFASAGRELTDRLTVEVDALWSARNTEYLQQTRNVNSASATETDTETYAVAGAGIVALPADWDLRVTFGNARSETNTLTTSAAAVTPFRYLNEVMSAEAVVDGSIRLFPGRTVRAAFGGGWRKESLNSGSPATLIAGAHESAYFFGELYIPVVPSSAGRPWIEEFDISLSARHEDYTDYGSTTTPKIGIRYVPFAGLTLRGTWGESFKTPTFQQQGQARTILIQRAANFGGPATGLAMVGTGGSAQLKPERSTSWTVGFDFSPPQVRSASLSATAFFIDYVDRVVLPFTSPTTALSNPIFAPFVTDDPSPVLQESLLSDAANVFNLSGLPYDPNEVVAFIDNRFTNASAQSAKGVDVAYRQDFQLGPSGIHVFADATWIRVTQQTIPTVPEVDISGTIFNVPEFRTRFGLTWEHAQWSLTGAINYLPKSTDNGVTPNASIDSWTTVDANFTYRFGEASRLLRGASLSVAVTNLFDQEPPFAASPSLLAHDGIYFDSVNASAIGRFVSATLRTRF